MGRPGDQFCWDNAEKVGDDRWRCKHCNKDFSGAASRIRNHLSGKGNDIGGCESVPSHIRQEAMKRTSKKRGRNSSSGEGNSSLVDRANPFQVSSSNGDLSPNANKGSDQEYTTDELVKFFVSRYLPVNCFKDPHFRTFLRRVAQHGVPSRLFRDDSLWIQKSVSNLEHDVNEYMLMVSRSWKTTGCTMICYHLNQGKGKPSALDASNLVLGFYCPKGFIFVEGRHLDFSNGIEAALKNHVLNLPIEDVTQCIRHGSLSSCELAHNDHSTAYLQGSSQDCVRNQIKQFWKRICTVEEDADDYEDADDDLIQKSDWVHNLIQNSERLYHEMLDSSFYKEWRQEDVVEKDADHMFTSLFKHLRSIMHLEDRFKARLAIHVDPFTRGLQQIINNNEFWSNGKQLLEALTPLMEIIDLVDTLVPTSGYLEPAMDKAKCSLKTCYDREVSKYQDIWDCFNDSFEEDFGDEVAAYLSPAFIWRKVEEVLDPTDPEELLKIMVEESKEPKAELEGYRSNNPFANLEMFDGAINHPVILWKKYGDKFPALQKYAIKVLSQPSSCMCNQVKKHMNRIHATDNFILRLNYQMMQEFTNLGDEIYKPLMQVHPFYWRQ